MNNDKVSLKNCVITSLLISCNIEMIKEALTEVLASLSASHLSLTLQVSFVSINFKINHFTPTRYKQTLYSLSDNFHELLKSLHIP